ncbi:phage terminase small subunit [Orbus wheelerorum]|uniref:phage terminase small subunit n=1 Tax=Orbus wheelerorum TaxID=3074111 RepID=UPI00370D9D87
MNSVLSPFQQHRERIRMMVQNKTSTLVDAPSSVHILNIELEQDIDFLRKNFVNTEDRIEYKRTVLLPKWQPKADQYLKEGKIYQNSIFVHCIIWLFDTEQFDLAIEWALVGIDQNQDTPRNFKSRLSTFVADTVFDWCEKSMTNGESIEPYFSQVFELIKNKWRLHEEISAKWYKLAGLNALLDDNGKVQPISAIGDITKLEQVKELFTTANNFYSKIGVGTRIKEIESRINALNK